MERLLIKGGTIINEGGSFEGYVEITSDRITAVGTGDYPCPETGMRVIDASGMMVIPGVIDDQVHFREPGLTNKGDIRSESMAAAAGGVTSYMEMPNTNPPATTLQLLEDKFDIAARDSAVNYSFYLGATNDNMDQIAAADPARVCGVKLFMGSSTGNMLVDNDSAIAEIFRSSPVIVAIHSEDEQTVRANMERFRREFGDRITPCMHPLIRSAEACYRSSARAVELAEKYGTRLHILHLSTARELGLLKAGRVEDKKITSEVCVHHLWFTDEDYAAKGNFIKWNPAIKTFADREALREGVGSGIIDIVATDHAPHTLEEKSRQYIDAPSGGPLVQHSLVAMMELCSRGIFTIEQVVDKMCHNPARLFRIKDRGFLREGYFADVAIVAPGEWTVNKENLLYKCGWSPFEGEKFGYRVACTIVNGRVVYSEGKVDRSVRGKALEFER